MMVNAVNFFLNKILFLLNICITEKNDKVKEGTKLIRDKVWINDGIEREGKNSPVLFFEERTNEQGRT